MADRKPAYALNQEPDDGHGQREEAAGFALPVDSEHKARKFNIFSQKPPHMRGFHLAWLSFFICFTSTFAAPPLIPILRDCLNLTHTDIGNANMASLSGSIFARLVIGALCDVIGPRYACAGLMIGLAPAVFSMAIVTDARGFLIVRFFVGCSLATFVTCQFWMSSMFNARIVGVANAIAAGWGNMGGGATQLLMPLVVTFIVHVAGATPFTAWRIAFFVPGVLHVATGLAVVALGQDLPDGNFEALRGAGQKSRDSVEKVAWVALRNYRTWMLALSYAYSFGVQLTIDNIIAEYFYDKFNLNLNTAGTIAASSGLLNIFSRPAGGIMSDSVARSYGMRGRLWALWVVQTVAGVFCFLLGNCHTLDSAVSVMLLFSVFVHASCGLTFGVVPFVSLRALGIVSGTVAAGGNLGGVLTQMIFFTTSRFTREKGLEAMGINMLLCTLPITLIYFPQWGGMFCSARDDGYHTEEKYYGDEWSESEKQGGAHAMSMKFAKNTRGERGRQKPIVPSSDASPLQGGCPIPA